MCFLIINNQIFLIKLGVFRENPILTTLINENRDYCGHFFHWVPVRDRLAPSIWLVIIMSAARCSLLSVNSLATLFWEGN